LDGTLAVELIDLRGEGEIEFADGEGTIAGAPPDGFVRAGTIGYPHFHVFFVGADPLKGSLMRKVAGAELHGGIALAGRAQAIQFGEAFQSHFIEANFAVEAERGVEVFGFQRATRVVVEASAEGIEV
jgi:hypothetical protein